MPAYFLPIGAVANAIKGLSWMAGGSTKSVFKVKPAIVRQQAAMRCLPLNGCSQQLAAM